MRFNFILHQKYVIDLFLKLYYYYIISIKQEIKVKLKCSPCEIWCISPRILSEENCLGDKGILWEQGKC